LKKSLTRFTAYVIIVKTMSWELEPIDEEIVEDNVEPISDDDLYEVVHDEETNYISQPSEIPVPIKEFEQYRVYVQLGEHVNQLSAGFVTYHRNSWYLSAAPGIPFQKVIFEGEVPRVNSFIKIKRCRFKHKHMRGNRFERIPVIIEWEYAEVPSLPSIMSYKEFKNAVLEGIEFENRPNEELFVLGLLGSPLIFTRSSMIIGGVRAVVYYDYYNRVNRFVRELLDPLPKNVYQITNRIYQGLTTRTMKTLEKIAEKSYPNMSSVKTAVESIGILSRAERKYPYEIRELREHIFTVKVLTPFMDISNNTRIFSEVSYKVLETTILKDETRRIIAAHLGLSDVQGAIIRIAMANARKDLRKEVKIEDIKYATDKFSQIIDNLAYVFKQIRYAMTPSKISRIIEDIIRNIGYIDTRKKFRPKCIDIKTLRNKLVLYGIDYSEFHNIIEYLRLSRKIIKESDQVCLLD